MNDLAGKHIVLGLTGGIACYKSAELCRALVKEGATVQVVMTEASEQFITPVTMQALSGRPVYGSQWDPREPNNMPHINLSREADAILLAPCSADFMAKLLHGRADELLSLMCLARPIDRVPLLVAPSMNREMWAHPATQRNMQQLADDGATILGVGSGFQACGEYGDGRMLEPPQLLEDIVAFFQPKHLPGKRVLITAGPTFEAIDPVRGITNTSSGRMGFALARALAEAGATVTMVAGPTELPTPPNVRRIDVESAAQMAAAVMHVVDACDVFVAVAAVADYTPEAPSPQKLKKSGAPLTLTLKPTVDILATVAARPDAPYCVGFAAESQDVADNAEAKRRRKGVPLIVANRAQDAFGASDNEVTLLDDAGAHALPRMDKLALARRLVREIATRLASEK